MKKFISFILAITIIFSVSTGAFAYDINSTKGRADSLNILSLFNGTEKGYELSKAPTRAESLVMLIRFLGKENQAQSGSYNHPFKDVPAWADKYVGYAYQNGITGGVSATEFGSQNISKSNEYFTFILRALGYSDKSGDFSWDNPYDFAWNAGIMPDSFNKNSFLRGDLVDVSYKTLFTKYNNSTESVAEKLAAEGVFSKPSYQAAFPGGPSISYFKVTSGGRTAPTASERLSPAINGTTVASQSELNVFAEKAIDNLQKTVTFKVSGSLFSSAQGWINNLLDRYGEITGYSMSYTPGSVYTVTLRLSYSDGYEVGYAIRYPSENIALSANNQALKTAAEKIIRENITSGMTDYQKVKAIHDYLVLNTKYDTAINGDVTYTAYGTIINKTSVCDGYAKSFEMFMDALGIPCWRVTGKGNGGNHAWNKVMVGGKYYNVDVTWDDPVPDRAGYVSYKYFLISDTSLRADHTFTDYAGRTASENYAK